MKATIQGVSYNSKLKDSKNHGASNAYQYNVALKGFTMGKHTDKDTQNGDVVSKADKNKMNKD